ncbi:MAG: 6-hydroxymethylpterin diphosphokinase MptE-like protein [Promethearchaeota archaeon]
MSPPSIPGIQGIQYPVLARRFHEEFYGTISRELDLHFDDDGEARDLIEHGLSLGKKISDERRHYLQREFIDEHGEAIVIISPGPSMEGFLNDDELVEQLGNYTICSVDGASNAILKTKLKVDLLVTDLDGISIETLQEIHDHHHALCVIHCHGDNIDKLKRFLDTVEVDERYTFTTQVKPTRSVFNWGGFTDGDRAIFAAITLGFQTMYLLSMDLDAGEVGRYSKADLADLGKEGRNTALFPTKLKKLRVATSILRWLVARVPPGCKVYSLFKEVPFDFIQNIVSF